MARKTTRQTNAEEPIERARTANAVPQDLFALWEVARKCIQSMERMAYWATSETEDERFAAGVFGELRDLRDVVTDGIPLFNESPANEELDPETPEPIKVGPNWYTSAHNAALGVAHELLIRAGNTPLDDPQVMLDRVGAIRAMILNQDIDYRWLLTRCSMEVTAAERRRAGNASNLEENQRRVIELPVDGGGKKMPKRKRGPKPKHNRDEDKKSPRVTR